MKERGGASGLRWPGLLFAGGALLCAILAPGDPERFLHAWLVAFSYVLSIGVGALGMLALAHAVRVRWFPPIRRVAEWPVTTLQLGPLLVLPLLVGASSLYPWGGEGGWMALPAFVVRTLIGTLVLAFLSVWFVQHSLVQEEGGLSMAGGRMQRAGALALPVLGLVGTFGPLDWLMSLQPDWASTIFGLYWLSGGFVGGIALICVLLPLLWRRDVLQAEALRDHRIALGKVLLAATIFWAYVAFFQILLIWIADIPREVVFYRQRIEGEWGSVSFALGLLHFGVPFAALLSRQLKASRTGLVLVGGLLLVAHWLDTWWLVMPLLLPDGPSPRLIDVAALATAIGGAGLLAVWRWRGQSLVVTTDPDYARALRYRAS